MPSQHRLDVIRDYVIPQRLKVIAVARKMVALESEYSPFSTACLMIHSDNGNKINAYSDYILGFTQPIIDSAILHCRCLLDFLGLGIDQKAKSPALSQVNRTRHRGDIGIEHFSGTEGALKQLTPIDAISQLPKNDHDYALAWATVAMIANQRLAHSTEDKILIGNINSMLELSFDSLPELVCRVFYQKLGLARPAYQMGAKG